jgi:hypothetical protein
VPRPLISIASATIRGRVEIHILTIMSDKLQTRIVNKGGPRPGTVLSRSRYKNQKNPIHERGLSWKYKDGECLGYKTHPGFYGFRKATHTEVATPVPNKKPTRTRKERTAVRKNNHSWASADFERGYDWQKAKVIELSEQERKVQDDEISGVFTSQVKELVERDFRTKNTKAYGRNKKTFAWARFHRTTPEIMGGPFGVGTVATTMFSFILRGPMVITPLSPTAAENWREVLLPLLSPGGFMVEPPQPTILAIPPMMLHGVPIAVFIRWDLMTEFLAQWVPGLRDIVLRQAINQYLDMLLNDYRSLVGAEIRPSHGYQFNSDVTAIIPEER